MRKRRESMRYKVCLAMLIVLLMVASPALAAVPGTVNYQGYLTDSGGEPVHGSQDMTFSIHDALSGGTQLQDDDLMHSYTLGKATEDVDWDAVTETVIHDGVEYKAFLIAVVYTSG